MTSPIVTSTPPAAPSLADRLVAERFGISEGALTIGGVSVTALAERYGTPFYAYDVDGVRRTVKALQTAVAGFAEVYFSIKANPRADLARVMVDEGLGLEIASGQEFQVARAAGCAPERILFAGPGKGEAELRLTIQGGIGEIHLESFEEIALVGRLAAEARRIVDVSIRVNPVASASGGAMRMGGKPAPFGFDEEIVDDVIAAIRAERRLRLTGVHLFAGTQVLDAAVLVQQWRHGLSVAAAIADRLGAPLASIDLGGGLGIPYHGPDATLDLDAVRAAIPELKAVQEAHAGIRDAKVILEPGRYLMGPNGIYVMAVRSSKQSRDHRFLVCDGGMHHHLAASGNLGQVIKRDYPLVPASRMLDPDRQECTVVGPLCTPLDTLGRQTPMPELKAGDLIAVLQSGAYGLTASPAGFLSHPAPAEILVEGGVARRLGEPAPQVLRNAG